jgi:hypothetical protein
VELDGKPLALPAGALTTTFQVNPGPHALVVHAAEHADGAKSFTVQESDRKVVSVALAPVSKGEPPPDPSPTPPERVDDDTTATIVMWTGFAVGLAGIAAGAVTGGLSLSTSSDLDTTCSDLCPESARPDHDRAIALANASNATFAIGGAGIVVGLIALIVIVSSDEQESAFRARPGAIALQF